MTDFEFFLRLIEYRCEGCPAYEELGHCGAYGEDCIVITFDEFLQEMHWDEEYVLDYIAFMDFILPEIWLEEEYEEYMKEMVQGEYVEGMWDYEDEPFCYM